jgi:hypothetical protein
LRIEAGLLEKRTGLWQNKLQIQERKRD